MKVSIVLVAYHGDHWLPACVDSLAGACSSRVQLVLVDNTGNSIFDALGLDRFDTEVVLTPRPMGFAEANNHALVHASRLEDAVLFLNQDTVSTPGWIDACLTCLAQDETLGAVSPLIRTYDGDGWDPSFLECVGSEEDLQRRLDAPGAWFEAEYAPAPALLVRTGVLRRAGPFDPIFGSYYEDYDLCRRIRQAGYQVGFCRTATIRHYSGSATNNRARELKRMRQIIRNRLICQLRAADRPRWRVALRQALVGFPHRLARGLFRTAGSQPPAVVLKAHGDLLRIAGRLVSRRRDEAAWQRYLDAIGWRHTVTDQHTIPEETLSPTA